MNLRFWRPKQEIYGVTLSEPGTSSQVSGDHYPYVRPEVDFATCYDYYRTIGKVQNAVESYVSKILSRDWYFEGDKEAVKACEEWEERFNLSRIIEYIVRDWLVCGNSIIGVSDWQPVQISSIAGMKRSPYGQAEQFVQLVNGREVNLDASKFVHTQYIELNREAWGIGMFHSLLATFAYGKKRSLPHLEIYRRQIQLFYRILERYGSPVTVWFFENVAKAEFDRQVEELRALEPGDRRILSKKVEIATETIDGRGNLINATSPVINQEIEAGLQTSANRLITQPSAMADTRISEEKDSARLLGIMEKIRRMMNALVIPRITSGKAEFRWGKQDNFQFDFGQLLQAKSAGFVSAEEGRAILSSVGWKLDDRLFNSNQSQTRNRSSLEYRPNPRRNAKGQFGPGPDSNINVGEPIVRSETPASVHKRSAAQVMGRHRDKYKQQFLEGQAMLADQLRAEHEIALSKVAGDLTEQFPDSEVTARVKDRTEMLKKMAVEPEKYSTVADLPDISGARIVAGKENLDEVRSISEKVKSQYNIINEKDYLENPKEGYRAIHLYVRDIETGVDSEIQIRTPNQNIWAEFTHDKIYKQPLKERVAANIQEIREYTDAMSNYFYRLDKGETNVKKPDAPKIIEELFGGGM